MARVTVEDCIDKVDSPYELVLVAKERATQLNTGIEPTLDKDNDKNTVIALREIGDGKISIKTLEDSAINKLRNILASNVGGGTMELVWGPELSYTESNSQVYKFLGSESAKNTTLILLSYRNVMYWLSDRNNSSSSAAKPARWVINIVCYFFRRKLQV